MAGAVITMADGRMLQLDARVSVLKFLPGCISQHLASLTPTGMQYPLNDSVLAF